VRAPIRSCAFLLAVAAVTGCIDGPKVVQGTVASYDPAGKVVVVNDETRPGQTMELSLEGAEIGAAPVAGDTVRIAYRDQDGKLRATRVMNISRQAEIGKKGGGSAGAH